MYEFWPHSPKHFGFNNGIYMVTCGTYQKEPLLNNSDLRTRFCAQLFRLMEKYDVELQAWAVMSNHYHIIVKIPADNTQFKTAISELHRITAIGLNKIYNTPGKKVWFNYWESRITFQKSYYARLNYVLNNPVHHKVVTDARLYPHCSYGWFETNANPAFRNTIMQMDSSRVNVPDPY